MATSGYQFLNSSTFNIGDGKKDFKIRIRGEFKAAAKCKVSLRKGDLILEKRYYLEGFGKKYLSLRLTDKGTLKNLAPSSFRR